MRNITTALTATVPISLFNQGNAGKIFKDVKETGPKVVIKNNVPECVLISPDEYIELMDALNDAKLLAIAMQRMESANLDEAIDAEEIYKKYNITEEDLEGYDEVEIE